jgi:hypothetical protein
MTINHDNIDVQIVYGHDNIYHFVKLVFVAKHRSINSE